MKLLVFIREIFKKFPLLLISNVFLFVSVGVFGACSLLLVGPLVDLLVDPQLQNASPLTKKAVAFFSSLGIPATLASWAVILIVFIALVSVFQVLARRSILKTKYAVLRDLMLGTFEDFFNARWYFFSSGKQGMLLNTFTREITVIGDAFGAMALFFANILQLGFALVIPFYISWQVTLISLGVALLFAVPFTLVSKYSYRLGKLNTATANEMTSVVHENLGAAKLLLGFGNQYKGNDNFAKAFDAHRNVTVRSQIVNIAIPILYRPFAVLMAVMALFAARRFGVALSEITVLLFALFQVAISVSNIMSQKNALENFFPSYEQIKGLRERARQMRQPQGTRKFAGFKDKIVIEGVSFAYPGHSLVLKEVNVSIPKGKMIALVGKSGAGKSTLVDILMGFHEPTQGRLMFDGVPFTEYDINSYRSRLGYVPQDSVLFNMSILDNLLWANPSASQEQLEEACRLAYADEFVSRLPEGYGTLVGDRGVRLSGGQVQRMALARAFIRQPELLILDEATSSLDTHSERFIQKAIENISSKTTVIVVAHRLSTIKKADRIYVLEHGKVVEEGTYADLVGNSGRFNSMVKLQELEVLST